MTAFRIVVPASVERGGLVAAVVVVAATAWLAIGSADGHVHTVLDVDAAAGAAVGFSVSSIARFVAAWTGMSVAMMLPTSLPILTVLHTFAGERADRWLLVTLAAVGYLAAWIAVGALIGPLSVAAQAAAVGSTAMGSSQWLALPVLLLVAGLFQFSALKYRCLEKCRSPLAFVLSHWRGERQRWHAFRLGWASGVFCVGCCWALMALMLVTSVQHVVLMLVLGAIMAVEKNVRWGRRLSAPLGIVLIACALAVFSTGGDLGWLARAVPELCGTK